MAKAAIITGASSGIGRALSFELASRGYDLGLSARRTDALGTLRKELEETSSVRVVVRGLDVQDVAAVYDAVRGLADSLGEVELVVANAGVALNRRLGSGRFERDQQTIATNVLGAMATIDAAAELFIEAGRGHIVALSSVAAYRGMPGLAAYAASKAAIAAYAETARVELRSRGIGVTTLFPGYIDTPLNEDVKSRPFLISASDGAKRIADLVERGVTTSSVPVLPWSVVGFLMRTTPDFVWDRLVGSGPPRKS